MTSWTPWSRLIRSRLRSPICSIKAPILITKCFPIGIYDLKIHSPQSTDSNSYSNTPLTHLSIFYVFYEQYLTVWRDATIQLITTLAAIFLCTFILLSFDLYTALIVTVLIAIIIIDMVGIMVIWDIELNAISLVNLVIVRLLCLHHSFFFIITKTLQAQK